MTSQHLSSLAKGPTYCDMVLGRSWRSDFGHSRAPGRTIRVEWDGGIRISLILLSFGFTFIFGPHLAQAWVGMIGTQIITRINTGRGAEEASLLIGARFAPIRPPAALSPV
jgi:hypothetical protein